MALASLIIEINRIIIGFSRYTEMIGMFRNNKPIKTDRYLASRKAENFLVDYLLVCPMALLIASVVGIPWVEGDLGQGVFRSFFFMIGLLIFLYETGYKKYYRLHDRHKYFYAVFAVPTVLAVLSLGFATIILAAR